jgi:hypothetical protein
MTHTKKPNAKEKTSTETEKRKEMSKARKKAPTTMFYQENKNRTGSQKKELLAHSFFLNTRLFE